MLRCLHTILVSSVAAAVLALPAAAGAHHPEAARAAEIPPAEPVPARVAAALGEKVVPLAGGLYKVKVPGPNLVTHGPDPQRDLGSRARAAGALAGGVGFRAGDAERAPVCATDYYQHVLYGRLATGEDRLAQVKGDLQAAVRRMNAVLNADATEYGTVSADYKVLCDGAGAIQVDGFVSTGSGFSAIVTSARAAGFDAATADYTIFFDASSSYCGVGSYAEDESPLITNASNQGGGYGVAYRDCWLNETPMHENGHTQGAVQYNAPYSTGTGGHCYDEDDVLCYSPDGGDLNQGGTILRCSERIHFDCGGDDYFNPAPLPGAYLATHWNLGSAVNRFIVLGLPGGGDDGTSPPPVEPTEPTPTVVLLRNGVRTRAESAAPGGWRYFKTRLPRGRRALRIVVRGGPSQDLDLYVRRGGKPTLESFSCRSTNRDSAERCLVRRPRPGLWFAGVYNFNGAEGSRFTIRADALKFKKKKKR